MCKEAAALIIDFNSDDIRAESLPRTIVIGAGPVGLAVATGLRRRGVDVLVLESGSDLASSGSEFNDGDVLGLQFTGLEKRGRGLGGGTSEWAGQCLRFHAADFCEREWISGSGWPLGYDDLLPFYSEAEQFFGVSSDRYFARVWRDFGLEPGGLVDPDVLVRFSVFARKPRVFERDRRAWASDPGVWFIYNATVVGLRREGASVGAVDVKSQAGKTLTVPADVIVLCVGAIEAARMLLESTPDFPSGAGGGNPHVGRHFLDHPNLTIGVIKDLPGRQGFAGVTRFFSAYHRRGVLFLPRLVLSADRQRELRMLNACGIHFDFIMDPIGTVAGVYRHFGIDLTYAARQAMQDMRAESRQGPRAAKHTYSLADFGLTDEQVGCASRVCEIDRRFAEHTVI